MPKRSITFRCPTSNRIRSSRSQQGVHEGVGQPILVFLRRLPTLAHQHPVYVPPGKHPEDIPSGSVIKPRSKPPASRREMTIFPASHSAGRNSRPAPSIYRLLATSFFVAGMTLYYAGVNSAQAKQREMTSGPRSRLV
jgi:hypothetical protein